MHFFQSTDRIFIAEQLSGLIDSEYIDTDEYFSSPNIFFYFSKYGL